VCPIWLPVFFYNEPELGVGIDPGMALTPLPSSIGRGLNPQPSDREPSALLLDHSFCLAKTNFGRMVLCLNFINFVCPHTGNTKQGMCPHRNEYLLFLVLIQQFVR